MDPVTMTAILAGMQLLNSKSQNENRSSDLRLKAMETEMSPWSGLAPSQQVGARSNPLVMAGQGALSGYQTGSNIEQTGMQNELMREMVRTEQMKQQMGMARAWRGIDAPVIPYNQESYSAVV